MGLCPKSLQVLSELSPPAPISHLGTKLFVYGFSVFDLRVISEVLGRVEGVVVSVEVEKAGGRDGRQNSEVDGTISSDNTNSN